MTYIVSGGALNSTQTQTPSSSSVPYHFFSHRTTLGYWMLTFVSCYEPLPTALLTDYTAHCQMGYNIVLFIMLYYNLVDAQLSQLGLQGKTKRTKNAHAAQQQRRRQGT